jgi:D-glycero-alpha-D-manno-heptose 1-phosphate guanylyltransferase
MQLEAVVLAGGFGTRLQPVLSQVPKSMAVINGRPFLEYLFDQLIDAGFTRVILSVGFRSEVIHSHFRSFYKTLKIHYAFEAEPLGTGGGIRNAFASVKGKNALVMNGDSIFKLDISGLHNSHNASGAVVSIGLAMLAETARFGMVETDESNRIIGFHEKKALRGPGLINGGVYIINRGFILNERFPAKFSIEKDCFEKYYKEFPFYGFPDKGYFLDIGIPSDYQKAQNEFKNFEAR